MYIGIDLGGTKIAAALLNSSAETVILTRTIPTQAHEGPDAVLQRIAGLIREVCQSANISLSEIQGIGLGVPATLDFERGVTFLMPNLPGAWYEKPVVAILEQALNRPVHLINDARAFTLAEATLGAGRGAHTVACFTLGTGIGGGIAIGGQLHLGLSGAAGEFGHQTIDMYGTPDGSGNAGGWEGYASGPAIAAMGVKAVMQGITTRIGELVNFDLNRITPETIMQAAEQGDALAKDILDRAGFYLGTGISNVIIILSPNRVVIGGGVAKLGEWIMKPIMQTIHARCHTVPLDQLEIVQAALGNEAGMIGTALWAWQKS